MTRDAPRGPLSNNAKVGIALAAVVILAIIIGLATSGSSSSDQKLSADARTYLDHAMPLLSQVTSEFQSGNASQATADWNTLTSMPVNNNTDDYVSGKYTTYANNVRYYIVNDGSVNLKQLEESQTAAEQAISAFE